MWNIRQEHHTGAAKWAWRSFSRGNLLCFGKYSAYICGICFCVEEDAHTSELKGYYNLIYMYMRGPLYSKRVCERLPASVRVLSACVFTCLLACLCGRATACYNPSLNMYDEEEVQATIAVSPEELWPTSPRVGFTQAHTRPHACGLIHNKSKLTRVLRSWMRLLLSDPGGVC